MAFNPDDSQLAFRSSDEIILWDIQDGSQIGESLTWPTGGIKEIAFNSDGSQLAILYPREIILWDVQNGSQIGEPLTGNTGEIKQMAFNPNDLQLASRSLNEVILWNLLEKDWENKICSQVSRNLTLDEWRIYFPTWTIADYHQTCPNLPKHPSINE
jgi:WD40 repeat protein